MYLYFHWILPGFSIISKHSAKHSQLTEFEDSKCNLSSFNWLMNHFEWICHSYFLKAPMTKFLEFTFNSQAFKRCFGSVGKLSLGFVKADLDQPKVSFDSISKHFELLLIPTQSYFGVSSDYLIYKCYHGLNSNDSYLISDHVLGITVKPSSSFAVLAAVLILAK